MTLAQTLESGIGQILGSAPVETAAVDVTGLLMKIVGAAGIVACPACGMVIGAAETLLTPVAEAEVKNLLSAAAAKLEGATPPATGSVAQALGAVETTIATEVETLLDKDGSGLVQQVAEAAKAKASK